MKLLVCIDDTDSKTSEKGTGAIADDIRYAVRDELSAKISQISRHQLLIHPDVPYTSHNSSMCFEAELDDGGDYEGTFAKVIETGRRLLLSESAPESDPGLAVADIDKIDTEAAIAYGKECKYRLVTKQEAYDIAKEAGFYLNEFGGTGDGVIGAAAGIGLRLWGFDGTMKGRPKDLEPERAYSVKEICCSKYVDVVRSLDGTIIAEDETVILPPKAKIALYDGTWSIMADEPDEDGIRHLPHREIVKQLGGDLIFKEGCADFKLDVPEERYDDSGKGCYNCLYRRWLEKGVLCQKPEKE